MNPFFFKIKIRNYKMLNCFFFQVLNLFFIKIIICYFKMSFFLSCESFFPQDNNLKLQDINLLGFSEVVNLFFFKITI